MIFDHEFGQIWCIILIDSWQEAHIGVIAVDYKYVHIFLGFFIMAALSNSGFAIAAATAVVIGVVWYKLPPDKAFT